MLLKPDHPLCKRSLFCLAKNCLLPFHVWAVTKMFRLVQEFKFCCFDSKFQGIVLGLKGYLAQ